MADQPQRLFRDAHDPFAWVVRIGGADQSFIDPTDPTRLEFDYVQRIADVVDLIAPAGQRVRAVHVGGAGMTLPRYIAHTRPTSAQIVLEPDEHLTAEVRAAVPLPPRSGIKVRPIGGREGLAAMSDGYCDLVIVDAFAGAQVPGELVTIEAMAGYRRVLSASGTLVLNVTDAGQLTWTRRLLAGAQRYFPTLAMVAESSTLKGRRFGNIVVIATRRSARGGDDLDWQQLGRRAAGAAFPFRLTVASALDRFVGGAGPMFDASASASPPPPNGAAAFR